MTISAGGISVFLQDETGRFQTGMRNAASLVEQAGRRMQTSVAGAERSVRDLSSATRGFSPDAFRALSLSALRAKNDIDGLKSAILAIPALAGGFGGAIAAQQLVQRADAYTNLKNRIASVVEGSREQIAAERDLFDVAQRTRTSLQANASLFARLRSSSGQLAADPDKLLRVVETVQKSFNVGGATTAEAQSAALQLSQALGSGRLQGDELRSILENNIPLAKLIAKEFGVGVGQLKELGSEGVLTSDRVVKAILDGSAEIDATFKRLKPTIESSIVVLSNGLTRAIGQFDEATGMSAGLAKGIMSVANNLDTVGSAAVAAGALFAAAFAGRQFGAVASGIKGAIDAQKEAKEAAVQNAQKALSEARSNLGSAYQAAYAKREKTIKAESDALKRVDEQAKNNLQGQIDLQNKADQIRQKIAASRVKDEQAASSAAIGLAEKQAAALEKAAQARARLAQAEDAYQKKLSQEVQPDRSKLTGLYDAQFERAQRQDDLRKRQAAFDEAKARRDAFATKYDDPSSDVGKRYGGDVVQRQFDIAERQRTAALQRYYDSEEKLRAESVRADALAEKQKTAAARAEMREREAARRSLATAEKQAADSLALTPGGQKTSAQALADLKALSKAEADLAALKKQEALIGTAQTLQRGQVSAAQNARGATPEMATALDAYKKSLDNVTAAQAAQAGSSAVLGAAWRGLSAVGSSLFSFLGGPWGVALTAVSLGMAAYGVSIANAEARSRSIQEAKNSLVDTLNRVAAAANASGKALDAVNPSRLTSQIREAESALTSLQGDALYGAISQNVIVMRQLAEAFDIKTDGRKFGDIGRELQPVFENALKTESGARRAAAALESLSQVRPDIDTSGIRSAIADIIQLIGAVNKARALAGQQAFEAGTTTDARDERIRRSQPSEADRLADARSKFIASEKTLTKEIEDQALATAVKNQRLQDELKTRQEMSRLSKEERAVAEIKQKYPTISDKDARDLAASEEAQGKRGGGGKKGGGKGFSPEDRFDNKVSLIRQEGRSAFFSDLDRQLISQLREIKSDPGLAERTVNAIKSGGALPERAQQLRDANELKRSGELAREARDQYGSLSDVLPLVAERQRILNLAVSEGHITQETANKAVAEYVQKLPQMQPLMSLADGISSAFQRAVQTFDGSAKSGREAIKGFLKDLMSLGQQQFIFEPLKNAMRSLFATMAQGGQSGGGWLGSLLGFGGGGSGPMKIGTVSASTVPSNVPMATGAILHSGGFRSSSTPTRAVPASTFAGASRFHSGLKTNEFAAILEEGEAVLTGKQQAGVAKMVNSAGSISTSTTVVQGNTNITITGNADSQAIAEMKSAMAKRDREFVRNVNAAQRLTSLRKKTS